MRVNVSMPKIWLNHMTPRKQNLKLRNQNRHKKPKLFIFCFWRIISFPGKQQPIFFNVLVYFFVEATREQTEIKGVQTIVFLNGWEGDGIRG